MSSIMDKLKKNSRIKTTSILSESKFFNEKDMVPTDVPMVNVALSGSIDGGLAPGLTVLAGPSKHFKTSFGLIMASAYLKKYKDAVLLFYDSEFGSPQSYFEAFEVDTSRVLHTPVTNIEELKLNVTNLDKAREIFEELEFRRIISSLNSIFSTNNEKNKSKPQKIKEENNVDIIMTLTTPNCPEAQTIPEKVADVVSLLKGVNEVKVEITWDPPWTQDNMTDAAKLELGLM